VVLADQYRIIISRILREQLVVESLELVDELQLDNRWVSAAVAFAKNLVAEVGGRSGTQRKRNVHRWKALPSNNSEDRDSGN
jgi:hypothetical protein